MNVVLFGPRFTPNADGVGDHAALVTESLVRAGHDVVVVTETPLARPRCEVVRVRRFDLAAFAKVVRAVAGQPVDLAIFEYTPFNFGARTLVPHALAAWFRLRGARVATFMHEGFYRPDGTNPMHPLKATLLGARDGLIAVASNALFAASRERADAIVAALPMLRSKVHVVPIGANVEPSATLRWQAPSEPPYRIVAFGVVAPRRRIALAIEMVAAAKRRDVDVELVVVGRVYDEAYAACCRDLARERGVEDRVRFTRELEPAAITDAFMSAHLAVHALFEGTISSSGSLLAVLAHGVPLLAVKTPRDERAYEDVVSFVAEDPEAMLEAALAILRSPDRGRALGARARERYERDCAWDRIAERAVAIAVSPKPRISHARS